MPRALVIGGRRGIGAAVVQALAAKGMDVTYTYRTPFDGAACGQNSVCGSAPFRLNETFRAGQNVLGFGSDRRVVGADDHCCSRDAGVGNGCKNMRE